MGGSGKLYAADTNTYIMMIIVVKEKELEGKLNGYKTFPKSEKQKQNHMKINK